MAIMKVQTSLIRDGAWWCKCCARNKGGCTALVPYYCSSPSCSKWLEYKEPETKTVKHGLKWFKNHVLVETI
jgi:hypothetical protein